MVLVCHMIPPDQVVKELCGLMGGSPHGRSPPFQVWWPYAFW